MLVACVALLRCIELFRDEYTLSDAQAYPRNYGNQIRIFSVPHPIRISASHACTHPLGTCLETSFSTALPNAWYIIFG